MSKPAALKPSLKATITPEPDPQHKSTTPAALVADSEEELQLQQRLLKLVHNGAFVRHTESPENQVCVLSNENAVNIKNTRLLQQGSLVNRLSTRFPKQDTKYERKPTLHQSLCRHALPFAEQAQST